MGQSGEIGARRLRCIEPHADFRAFVVVYRIIGEPVFPRARLFDSYKAAPTFGALFHNCFISWGYWVSRHPAKWTVSPRRLT